MTHERVWCRQLVLLALLRSTSTVQNNIIMPVPSPDLEKATPLDTLDGRHQVAHPPRFDGVAGGKEKAGENALATGGGAPHSSLLTPVFTNRSQGSTSLRPTRSYIDGHGYLSEQDPEDDDMDVPRDIMVRGSGEKTFEVGLDGPADPMNPKNMRFARKWMIVIVLAFGSLCVTCTSSLYTITYGELRGASRVPGTIH